MFHFCNTEVIGKYANGLRLRCVKCGKESDWFGPTAEALASDPTLVVEHG